MRIVSIAIASAIVTNNAAASENCENLANRIVIETGARISGRSPMEKNIFLDHPALKRDAVVFCAEHAPVYISMTWSDYKPPSDYFAFVGVAVAQVAGLPQAKGERFAQQCIKRARRSRDERAEISYNAMHMTCTAFKRDGGGNIIFLNNGSGPR